MADGAAAANMAEVCPICLTALDGGAVTTECAHRFCQDCFTKWSAATVGRTTCPVCRTVVAGSGDGSGDVVVQCDDPDEELSWRFRRSHTVDVARQRIRDRINAEQQMQRMVLQNRRTLAAAAQQQVEADHLLQHEVSAADETEYSSEMVALGVARVE